MNLGTTKLKLEDLIALSKGMKFKIGNRKKVEQCRKVIEQKLKDDQPYYGINTGFGYLANTKVKDLEELQTSLIRSHAAGYGNPLTVEESRLAMILRLNVLLHGLTGVRYELCEKLYQYIAHDVISVIPERGSVGASGDLAPLAHLALPLIGEGEVFYRGKKTAASSALKQVGIKPIALEAKEGLSLINGTQIMLAVGSLALHQAYQLWNLAHQIAALSVEGLNAHVSPYNEGLNKARNQTGQMVSARLMREHLKGIKNNPSRVQDPYSLRCIPQVHGAIWDTFEHSREVLEKEANGVTDNPLVIEDDIISGGNFHGEPLAFALDFAAIGLHELGSISERRIDCLLNPHISQLQPFLTSTPGKSSGYMAAQYLAASTVNETKLMANPASTDSIPGNVGIEDHVSMGMTSALKLRRMIPYVKTVLAIELITSAQAIDLRQVKTKNPLYKALRRKVKTLTHDRVVAEDIKKGVSVVDEVLS